VGIQIGKDYVVGPCIGTGAQASVHKLLPARHSQKTTVYAIKLAPVPSKITQKGTSVAEINARSIRKEYQLYAHQFPDLQKKGMLPMLARGADLPVTLVHGTFDGTYASYNRIASKSEERRIRMSFATGIVLCFLILTLAVAIAVSSLLTHADYIYLVMELMDAPLYDLVPAIVAATNNNKKKISMGAVAVRLLDIAQEIHATSHLMVDVKADNYMLTTAGTGALTPNNIRLVDLGLFAAYGGFGGHRDNVTGDCQGTPLYASRQVHAGATPARRDDVEAVFVVVAELLIRATAVQQGTVADYEGGNKKKADIPTYLPWSREASDAAVGVCKASMLANMQSDFYQRMPAAAAKILFDCFQEIAKCGYKKEPDYDYFKEQMAQLTLFPLAKKKKAAPKKKSPVLQSEPPAGGRRSSRLAPAENSRKHTSTRYGLDSDDETHESPSKAARTYEAMDVDSEDQSEDEVFHDAEEPEDMQIDLVDSPDENLKPAAKRRGLSLHFLGGPLKNHSQPIVQGETDILVVGSNPAGQPNETTLKIEDSGLDDSHVRFTLIAGRRGRFSLGVQDLDSSNGTFIDTNRVRKGEAIRSNMIRFGDSQVNLRSFVEDGADVYQKSAPTRRSRDELSPMANVAKKKVAIPTPTAIGKLAIIEGPYKGKKWVLEKGGSFNLLIGSKPTTRPKAGETVVALHKDGGMRANQARLEYKYHKASVLVYLTDLETKKQTLMSAGKPVQMGDTVFKLSKF
jgi:hypothetical protein